MLKRLRRSGFWREESGVAAIELALVAIPFLGLFFVIVETGIVFLFGFTIDNATQKIARMIQTGQIQKGGATSAGDLRDKYMCPASGRGLLPSFIPCERIRIDVRTASSFGAANISKNFYRSDLRFCPGDSSAVVVVRVAFALPVFLPALAVFSNRTFGQNTAGLVDDFPDYPGWNHLVASAFVFQNEPFTSGSATADQSCV